MTEVIVTESGTGIMPVYSWWLVLIQGLAALILGIAFLVYPYLTLMVAVIFVGAYWFVSGIFSIISVAMDRTNMGWKILVGILGIIAGLVILVYPIYSTILLPTILMLFIGVWGLIIGGTSLAAAFGTKDWAMGFIGIVAIIFGVLLIVYPMISAAILPFVLGGFGIVGGIITIVLAFQLKSISG
ncbi:MAG TPA: DUF308 domain-containing protein [Methanoregulaceae archaeon]|nr:DUF308 domain-containing protein [Methanoregulaceae archaeon]